MLPKLFKILNPLYYIVDKISLIILNETKKYKTQTLRYVLKFKSGAFSIDGDDIIIFAYSKGRVNPISVQFSKISLWM